MSFPGADTFSRNNIVIPMREFRVSCKGTQLFGVEDGDGAAVVMLHGALADHRAALGLVAPLAASYRVVVPDLRGSGRSWCRTRLSFDVLADDVAAVLDHLAIDRAVVGGVSSGSGVALRFALRHADRVRGVIVAKPIYAGATRGYSEEQREAFLAMDGAASRATSEGIDALRPLFNQLPEALRDRAWAVVSQFDPFSVVEACRFLASGEQPFVALADLEALEVPVLLVRGGDTQHPPELSDLYAASIRDCQVVPDGEIDLSSKLIAFCGRCRRTAASRSGG